MLTPPLTAGTPDEQLTATVRAGLRMALATSLLAVGDRPAAVAVVDAIIAGDLAKWPGVRAGIAPKSCAAGWPPNRRQEPGCERRRRRSGAELPRRERDVAVLLADRLTNGQLPAMVRGECACALPGP